jgi:preprotein translocase subunit SecA
VDSEEFLKVYGLDVIVVPTHRPVIRKDLNDLIFQTEKGKFQAIAKTVKELNQKGQPVLIGTISIEKNELLSVYLRQEGVQHTILNAKNHEKEGEIIAQAGRRGAVTIATNMAGRGIDIKLGGNPIVPEEYEFVKSVGGLFVLGTERHEARRIDNQLRGRAGRQGDPGTTQFFVSLEDDLMRVFGSEKIKNMMGRFGIPEDQAIENSFIGRTLENAQKKIEGFHFDARKHTLEYDDVMNHQRNAIYSRRQKMLRADKEEIEKILEQISEGNIKQLDSEIKSVMNSLGDYEIIYINDGSKDNSLEELNKLKSVKIINLNRNYGQSIALDAGFKASQGDIIISLDGDLQNDPKDIPKLLDKLKKENLDVVAGWRKNRKDKSGIKVLTKTGRLFRKLIINDQVHDTGCTLRV